MYPFPNQPQPHQHYPPPSDFPPPTQQSQQPQQPPPSSSQHSRDRDQSRDPPIPTPHRLIGAPLNFSTGQFSGKHVRAELIELQKADLGRKYVSNPVVPSRPRPRHAQTHSRDSFLNRYARKDRRPLDPPPVVQLKFFYSYPGTERPDSEVENYELSIVPPCFLSSHDSFRFRFSCTAK